MIRARIPGGLFGGGAAVTTSDTPPTSPADGALWWDSTLGKLFVWYDDGDSSQWVPATPSGGTPSGGSSEALTPFMYGARIDGVTDDTVAFTAFLNACSSEERAGHIPNGTGPLITGPVSIALAGDLHIFCEATIRNMDGAALAARLLLFDGNTRAHSLFWIGGRFDGNSGGYSLLEVNYCDRVHIEIDESFDMVGNAASPGGSGNITLTGNNDVILRPGHIHDAVQGGAVAQGSVPRAIGLAYNTTAIVEGGLLKDLHCGIVTSGNQAVTITGIVIENLVDNGLYAVHTAGDRYLNGSITMLGCHLNGTGDEPLVHNFGGTVVFQGGSITGYGNAIGIQDAGMLFIDGARIIARGPGGGAVGPANVVKTRLNTRSAGVSIRNCYIEAELIDGAFYFGDGAMDYFEFENNRFHWIHNSAWTPNTLIMQWTTGVRFEVNNNVFEFSDATADIADGNWTLQFPSGITGLSSFSNNRLVNNTGNANAFFRASNIRQQLVTRNGPTMAVYNVLAEMAVNAFDLTRAEPGVTWGTAAPTVGYHSIGHVVRSIGPAQWGAAGWYCYASGTPGSFREYGYAPTILRGSAAFTIGLLTAGQMSAPQTLTVTGAETSDVIIGTNIVFAQTPLVIHANISSFSTITFRVQNISDATYDVNDASHANGPVTINALVAKAS